MEKQYKPFGIKNILNAFRIVLYHNTSYRKELILISFLVLLVETTELLSPIFYGHIVNALTEKNMASALTYLGISFVLFLIGHFAGYRKSIMARWVEENTRVEYLSKTSRHILEMPLSFFKNRKMDDTRVRMNEASQNISTLLGLALFDVIPSIIGVFVTVIILFIIQPIIGGIALLAIGVYIALAIREIPKTVPLQRQERAAYRNATWFVGDIFTNARSVKDSAAEEVIGNKIRHLYKDVALPIWYKNFNIRRRTGWNQGWVRESLRFGVLGGAIYFIFAGKMTVGSLVTIISYFRNIFFPLSTLTQNWQNIQNGVIALEDMQEILELPQENNKKKNIASMPEVIAFNNVSFRYENQGNILSNIHFDVRKGETIALVGKSGVGKSTLIDLILGYLTPSAGEITFDNISTTEISPRSIRQHTAVVSQEIVLFNDTIKNNIVFGSSGKTDLEITEAARKAHIYEFIMGLPLQWEQVVGERGMKLSVGQKQRIAIARAILRNPSLLILDEPTSALDAHTESELSKSLEELMRGRTTIIIAHRLSTVRGAHKIVVLKDGAIAEMGTHKTLTRKKNGEYKKLHDLQSGRTV